MKNLNAIILTLFAIVVSVQESFALNVVYPKKNEVTINSPSTFFIGASNPKYELTVNGEHVAVHPSGGFEKVVKLDVGFNIFKLKSEDEEVVYRIYRPDRPKIRTVKETFIPYGTAKIISVDRENAPLRSTPVQEGINRISHFQKTLEMQTDGELGEMYRVKLSPITKAWIAKSDVVQSDTQFKEASIFDYKSFETKDYYVFEFLMSDRVPYTVTEGDALILKFFNMKDFKDNTAIFDIDLKQRLIGYTAYYNENKFVLKIRKNPNVIKLRRPLKNITVVVDAGHGGNEKGAIGCLGDNEKDINLSTAKYLSRYLSHMGANVVMTRNSDVDVSLNDRVQIANVSDGVVFVSIHANALPDSGNPAEHSGSSVYYYYDQAKPLADAILTSMGKSLPLGTEGVKQASFAVVRNTSAVSVLVETAYMINPNDNALLIKDGFRKKCAKSIANGVKNYIIEK